MVRRGEHPVGTLREALELADPRLLCILLFHATGRQELLDCAASSTLSDEDAAHVRAAAERYYRDGPPDLDPPRGDPLEKMITALTGSEPTAATLPMFLEELAFEDTPRAAHWTRGRPPAADDFTVLVVGAGASGIAVGVQLNRLGIAYDVIERQDDLGGTWHLNTYPDARVDVSSDIYQFTFDRTYHWPEYFAPQQEVQKYLRHIAVSHGVLPHISFDTELTSARWDEARQAWQVTSTRKDGAVRHAEYRAILSCAGMFSSPKRTRFTGAENFGGTILHTTAWDNGYDFAGKRVATIGNGSSGAQLMPRLARSAAHLYAFQRTPQWMTPKQRYHDKVPPQVHWLLDNIPYYRNWNSFNAFADTVVLQDLQTYDGHWREQGGTISRRNDAARAALTRYIERKINYDPELRAKLVPDHAPFARRPVVDNGYYDALMRDNVDLVTDPIESFTESGIRTEDGTLYEVDLIAVATGFDVNNYLAPTNYVGRAGVTTEELWAPDGPRAYLSMFLPGFPNLLLLYGPNSQIRTGSFLMAIEVWARFAAQTVVLLLESGHRALDVREPVFKEYNELLDQESKKILWQTEGPVEKNYYVNEHGRQTSNIPWRLEEFSERFRWPNLDDFNLS
jgi:4-hydroxyacetophenone monooxygenase